MPIFADSEVIPVRFSRPELDRLRAAAAGRGVDVTDVLRAAVFRYLEQLPSPLRGLGGVSPDRYGRRVAISDSDPAEKCACPEQHPTPDGTCANESIRRVR